MTLKIWEKAVVSYWEDGRTPQLQVLISHVIIKDENFSQKPHRGFPLLLWVCFILRSQELPLSSCDISQKNKH